MSKILNAIPPQGFELIRDKVLSILTTEIAAQFALTGIAANNATLYLERTVPYDASDLPAINVGIQRGEFDGQSAVSVDNTVFINIDVYCNAKSSSSERGDSLSRVNLERLLGVCRAILEAPVYKKLEFDEVPFIQSVAVITLEIAEGDREKRVQDAIGTSMGRLVLAVKCTEVTQLVLTTAFEGSDTSLNLGLTDKGYAYVVEN